MRLSNKSIREIREYSERSIQEIGYNIYSEVNKRLDIFLNNIFQIIQDDHYIDDIKYLHSNLKEPKGGFIDILYHFIEVIEHKGIRESIYDYKINIIHSQFSNSNDDDIIVAYSILKESIDTDKLKIHQMNQVLYQYYDCYKLTKDDLDWDSSVCVPMIYLDVDVDKFKKSIIDIIDSYSNLHSVLCENSEDYE